MTLGMEWALEPQASPSYKKERHRVDLCKERLRRLLHLPAALYTKIAAIRVGCLSLLAYGPAPSRSIYAGVSGSVKRALALPYAAPEILLNLLPSTCIDVELLWLLGLFKLLVVGIVHAGASDVWNAVPQGRRNSRFATLKKQVIRLGWEVDLPLLKIPGMNDTRLDRPWGSVRERIVDAYMCKARENLIMRRPALYGGLSGISRKAHKRMVKSLHPYRVMVLMKIWTGCAMTKSHKRTVGGVESGVCECGEAEQTLSHLLYVCPLSPPCPPSVLLWSSLPPAASSSLLFLSCFPPWLYSVWSDVCQRAVDILSKQCVHRPTDFDWKNHEVTLSQDAQYAFCIKCLVVRKSRDYKYIASAECHGSVFGNTCCEGDYIRVGTHLARCMFRSWKRAAARPKMSCVWCGCEWWPSSVPPVRCA